MLKRSAAVVLMMLYIVTASGFALNLHYCFNHLSSIQINASAKSCMKQPEAKKMKCCSDKHVEVKVKDAHQNGSFSFNVKFFAADIPKLQFAGIVLSGLDHIASVPSYRGPPPFPDDPLYLKNQNFRI